MDQPPARGRGDRDNVVIATQKPYPLAGNVPGTTSGGTFSATGAGNGAPCLPAGTSELRRRRTPERCPSTPARAPTRPFRGAAWRTSDSPSTTPKWWDGRQLLAHDRRGLGRQVNLTGPTTGPFAGTDGSPGIVLYQDAGTQANYGFDAQTGDAATIDLTGVVYNASLTNYGANSPQDYWDGRGGGIPFYAGGTLQTGFGAGWTQRAGAVRVAR